MESVVHMELLRDPVKILWSSHIGHGTFAAIVAVSYTHLDVYKRQLKTSFAKVRVYASLSHLSRGEMSKDGTQQVPPFELSPLRVNVPRGQ